MVSVSNDETTREAGAFAREVKATFPVVHDPKSVVFDKFGVLGMPGNVLIDRKGKVVWSHEGADVPALQTAVARAMAAK